MLDRVEYESIHPRSSGKRINISIQTIQIQATSCIMLVASTVLVPKNLTNLTSRKIHPEQVFAGFVGANNRHRIHTFLVLTSLCSHARCGRLTCIGNYRDRSCRRAGYADTCTSYYCDRAEVCLQVILPRRQYDELIEPIKDSTRLSI